MNQAPASRSNASFSSNSLTRRELQILQLLARGLSNKEIATTLCISHQTVSTHIKFIYDKLAVHTRLQAIIVGQQQGLIHLAGQDMNQAKIP